MISVITLMAISLAVPKNTAKLYLTMDILIRVALLVTVSPMIWIFMKLNRKFPYLFAPIQDLSSSSKEVSMQTASLTTQTSGETNNVALSS
jgi:hypothetical protein